MNRQLERTVFVVIIAAMGGIVAGLVMSQTLRAVSLHRAAPPTACPEPVEALDCPPIQVLGNQGHPQLTVARSSFAPGEAIGFVIGDGVLGESSWVGLIPSAIAHGDENVNDANDVDYRYVAARSSYQITAPSTPGTYDLRLHNQYPGGYEIAHVTITVRPPTVGGLQSVIIR